MIDVHIQRLQSFKVIIALAALLATAYGVAINSYVTAPVVYGNGWGMDYNLGFNRMAMPGIYSRGLIGSYGMPISHGAMALGRTSLNFV